MQNLLPYFPKLGIVVALASGIALFIGFWKIVGEKTDDNDDKTKTIAKIVSPRVIFFVTVGLLALLAGGYYLALRETTQIRAPKMATVPTPPPQQTLTRKSEIKITPSADKTEATITWPAGFGAGVLGYNVYLGANNNAVPRNQGVFITENSYVFRNLVPGQAYFIFVESVNLSPSTGTLTYGPVEREIFSP